MVFSVSFHGVLLVLFHGVFGELSVYAVEMIFFTISRKNIIRNIMKGKRPISVFR